ncbi:MAG: 23S rRNA (uracil(1939)-C(5))-methyltransferase RlmD, partial [Candidatus Saccharicenans sp.]
DEGLPGELVEVEVLKERKNYSEARTIRILESSSDRLKPACSHYLACSPYQVMPYELELKIKGQQLQEIFRQFLGKVINSINFIPARVIAGYRNKIKLNIDWASQPPTLAYHQPGSTVEMIPVDYCHLVSEEVNKVIAKMNNLLLGPALPGIQNLEIKQSFWRQEILLIFYALEETSLEPVTKLWLPALTQKSPVVGAVGVVPRRNKPHFINLYGKDYLEEKINQTIFRYGAGSFFQVNPAMLEKVIERIQDYLKALGPVKLADLYAGLGTFGLLLAAEASEILAVESEPANIYYLKKNLKINGIQHLTVAEGKTEDWLEQVLDFRPQVVILDPPRKGLSGKIISAFKEQVVELIFYLSCNPTTQARDLPLFQPEYRTVEITAFDFFPRTAHLETLAVLKPELKPH